MIQPLPNAQKSNNDTEAQIALPWRPTECPQLSAIDAPEDRRSRNIQMNQASADPDRTAYYHIRSEANWQTNTDILTKTH